MVYPPQEYRRKIGQRIAALRKKYHLSSRPQEIEKKGARPSEQLTMSWVPANGR
jgi:hypothetical protein